MIVKRLFFSVFTKLLLVLAVAGLTLNLFVAAYVRHVLDDLGPPPLHRGVESYIRHLARGLGDPPSQSKALELAGSAYIDLGYTSSQTRWATAPNLLAQRLPRHMFTSPDGAIRFGLKGGRLVAIVRMKEGKLTLVTREMMGVGEVESRLLFGLLAGLSLVMAVVWLAVGWIMKPVRLLAEGARRVGAGELDYEITLRRKDELGDLIDSFNTMTKRVARQIKAKEQLLLDVSHELRSPLTRMKVALEMMEPSRARQMAGQDVAEMEAMLTELLESARLEAGGGPLDREEVDLADLTEELIAFQPQPSALVFQPPERPIMVRGCRPQLKAALGNLITNALKYSPTGAQVRLGLTSGQGQARLSVSDSGPGIPAGQLDYIFEPFYRVDKSRSKKTGGYGLGLSLVKKIVEAHGGKVEVENNEDQGAVFTLVLPLAKAAQPEPR